MQGKARKRQSAAGCWRAVWLTAAAAGLLGYGHAQAADGRDFDSRCKSPGVILCDPLDKAPVTGTAIDASTPNRTLPEALAGEYRDWRWANAGSSKVKNPAVMDESVKVSGSGSLRFTIGSRGDANDAGYLQMNFTPDNSIQFGENSTFFVQWRQRFSCDLLFTDCDPGSPGYRQERRSYKSKGKKPTALKLVIINAGDHARAQYPVPSCTNTHIVVVHGADHALSGYHSCGWYSGFGKNLKARIGGSRQLDRQPGGNNHCMRMLTGPNRKAGWNDSDPDCIKLHADEWMTFQVQLTTGRWQPERKGPKTSNFKLWVGREGEPSQLTIDADFYNRGPGDADYLQYGKLWLVPYLTKKDPTEVHPDGHTWYDDIIISREKIPDPY